MNLGGKRPDGRNPASDGIVGQYTKKEQPLQFQITNVWTAGEERRGRKTSAVLSPASSSSGGGGGLFTTRNIFSSASSSPSAAGSPRLARSPRLFSSQRSRSLSHGGTEGRYTSNAAQGMFYTNRSLFSVINFDLYILCTGYLAGYSGLFLRLWIRIQCQEKKNEEKSF
jgi:hypothetical protein